MNSNSSFIDEIKRNYVSGGMHMKLIYVNVIVFLVITIFKIIGKLYGGDTSLILSDLTTSIFTLKTNPAEFILQPWGLITSIFAHFGFMHLLFNMLFLYFSGKMLEQTIGQNKLLIIYILGGISGGLFEIIAHSIFPNLAINQIIIVGASGSVMAIFAGLAYYQPNTEILLYGIIKMKIIWLAIGYFVIDLVGIGSNDGTAHFAHIGGALLGIFLMKQNQKSTGLLNKLASFINKIKLPTFYKKNNLTVKKGGRPLTDEEFNQQKKEKQEITDKILDKISKSGYESLSKSEKEFLFKQSKNG
jgi:membrane associated rhomboid family serine protease